MIPKACRCFLFFFNISAVPKPLRLFEISAFAFNETADIWVELAFENSNLLYITALGT